ncbi:MAG: zinc-dependent peptidase, partial [Cyclobacteriaceae bacterium]|nr:zinc-dependent peptidase [Cyclobacteriaceae bacterium]
MIPQKKQRLFRARVAKFIAMKEFVVRGDLPKVTDEMKVLIGSLAIQLTYGHPNIYFQNFYKILIYPDSYYSEISKNYHHGEVSPRGYIILSWKNFLEGWID